MNCRVLNLVLTHQSADRVAKMTAWWLDYVLATNLVLAYTGPAEEYLRIEHPTKFHVVDPRLQTRDHQRELQSYTGIFQRAAEFLQTNEGQGFTHVHFAEYDHLPLITEINERQIETMDREKADVLGFRVERTDGTNHPHTLYHERENRFHTYWASITQRSDPMVVLSMFGSGSFWTREAFLLTASRSEPFPMYLEIYLPTLAHHLGCRVRDFGGQNAFIHNLGERAGEIASARARGAWSIHPVKALWGSALNVVPGRTQRRVTPGDPPFRSRVAASPV